MKNIINIEEDEEYCPLCKGDLYKENEGDFFSMDCEDCNYWIAIEETKLINNKIKQYNNTSLQTDYKNDKFNLKEDFNVYDWFFISIYFLLFMSIIIWGDIYLLTISIITFLSVFYTYEKMTNMMFKNK